MTADLAATYQSAVDQMQLHIDYTPPGVLRLHALPVNVSTSRLGSREILGGGPSLLSGKTGHSPEDASALYVDLPARGGSFTVLNLSTPCGSFRQEFSLLERETGKTTVQVVTRAAAKVISTVTIDAANTDSGS